MFFQENETRLRFGSRWTFMVKRVLPDKPEAKLIVNGRGFLFFFFASSYLFPLESTGFSEWQIWLCLVCSSVLLQQKFN